jgi:hypothetical protein
MRLAIGEGRHTLTLGGEVFEVSLDRDGMMVMAFSTETREAAWWAPRPSWRGMAPARAVSVSPRESRAA